MASPTTLQRREQAPVQQVRVWVCIFCRGQGRGFTLQCLRPSLYLACVACLKRQGSVDAALRTIELQQLFKGFP